MLTSEPGSFGAGDQTQGFMQTRHHLTNRAQSPVPDSAALWKGGPWGNRAIRSAFSPAVLLQKAVSRGVIPVISSSVLSSSPSRASVPSPGVCNHRSTRVTWIRLSTRHVISFAKSLLGSIKAEIQENISHASATLDWLCRCVLGTTMGLDPGPSYLRDIAQQKS